MNGVLPVTQEWLAELSTGRYRPMQRLLDSRDVRFLRSQPGFHPAMEQRLRAQRVLIFRRYLHILHADFRRLAHGVAGDPAVRLRWQAQFACRMLRVQFRVTLYGRGFGWVDAAPLLNLFEELLAQRDCEALHAERVPA